MFRARLPSIFRHISQNATPATELAPCRHLTQPWQCDSQKARSTTRLKCCACHAKWRWMRPKCCAGRENSSCQNVAKVLCLPHKTIFDTLQSTSECHEVPRLAKRSNATFETSKNDTFCRTYHRHGHAALTRTVANGCEHKRNVERTHPQPPEWVGNPCHAFGKNSCSGPKTQGQWGTKGCKTLIDRAHCKADFPSAWVLWSNNIIAPLRLVHLQNSVPQSGQFSSNICDYHCKNFQDQAAPGFQTESPGFQTESPGSPMQQWLFSLLHICLLLQCKYPSYTNVT